MEDYYASYLGHEAWKRFAAIAKLPPDLSPIEEFFAVLEARLGSKKSAETWMAYDLPVLDYTSANAILNRYDSDYALPVLRAVLMEMP